MRTLCCCLLLCFVGCSDGGGTQVTGKVTINGGGPLTKGVVTISGNDLSYRGMLKDDGTYTLEGVKPGDYTVVITGAQEGGSEDKIEYDADGNYVEPENTKEPVPLIHTKYTNPKSSGLTLKVPGEYDLTVDKP